MKRLVFIFLCFFLITDGVSFAADFRFSPRTNKADLIHWRVWDRATLGTAKTADKPILLSLSAVWCHWCHVMDETTYSDEDVIAFINENFIPVRVDADRRPDIDTLYNQGGWPSTVVITSAGEIVRGGTYIMPDDMIGWLTEAVAAYKAGRGGMPRTSRDGHEGGRKSDNISSPSESDIARTLRYLESVYDKTYGGFGISQKFPNPAAVDFLLAHIARGGDSDGEEMVTRTLDRMARGEIYDSAGGGFFRYATTRDWSEPHYEKMLELNAAIAANYASAYKLLGRPLFKKVLIQTLDYVRTSLYDRKTGGFYGSQDADESYYRSARRRSLKAPYVDRTFYAGPNARMISAMAEADGVIPPGASLRLAARTADFMISRLYSPGGGVSRSYADGKRGVDGLLADNVLFGTALIDLYNAGGDRRYIRMAEDLGGFIIRTFFDAEEGRFRMEADTTLVRPSSPGTLLEYTTAQSNFQTAVFLLRLYHYSGDVFLRKPADAVIGAFGVDCDVFGPAAAICGEALQWKVLEPLELTVVSGKKPSRFLAEANKVFLPEKVVKVLSPREDAAEIKRLRYPKEDTLYLCVGKRCLASVTRPADVAAQIRKFMKALAPERDGLPSKDL